MMVEFACPACGERVGAEEHLLKNGIECPKCKTGFVPDTHKPVYLPDPQSEKQSARDKIHSMAEKLTVFSVIFFVLGALTLIIEFRSDAPAGYWLGGFFISAWFWLLLLAQVVHIRANTLPEK